MTTIRIQGSGALLDYRAGMVPDEGSLRRWSKRSLWLVLPTAIIDWFAFVPAIVAVTAFVIAVVGLAALASCVTVGALRRSRPRAAILGVALLVGGIAWLGLDPIPAAVAGIASWWPAAITLPQAVGAAYWAVVGLGVTLSGIGVLATLLVLAVVRTTRTSADG